jgi:hypothetical protein
MKKKWEKGWCLFKNKKEKHDILLVEGSLHFAHQVIANNNGKEIRLVCWKFKNDDVESLKKSLRIVCIVKVLKKTSMLHKEKKILCIKFSWTLEKTL